VTRDAAAQSHLALAQPAVPESLPAVVVRQLVVRLAEGLVEAGLDISVDPFPAGSCADAPCLRDMARAHAAAAIVVTRITAEGQNYRVELDLLDGATGQSVGRVQRPCNFCAYDELTATALEATRTLIREQRARQRTPSPPLRLVHRRELRRPVGPALAAIGLGAAATIAGALLLAAESDDTDARAPAVFTIAAGTALAGAGTAVMIFWPETDARGRFIGAAAAIRTTF
jgi:hypothetical protein